jgi:hypothetical protein
MYDKSVFINCPFDDAYTDILHAITFTVSYAGFIPRSALEQTNSGDERLSKIVKLVRDCRLSLHDISRVELPSPTDLPRFNMPFECGIFYGAMSLGGKKHQNKEFLVLDSEKYRYQKTMSDIAGKDPECHENKPEQAIGCVRRFLNGKDGAVTLPGEAHFVTEYERFKADLPTLLTNIKLTATEIRKLSYWKDYVATVQAWVTARAKDPA